MRLQQGLMTIALLAAAVAVALWPGCLEGSGPPPVPLPPGEQADTVALFLTGTTSGTLEPCNCPGQPRGGLSRRQTLFDQLKKYYPHTVSLDTGDMLGLAVDPIEDAYMLRGYWLLGYDAILTGDQELDRGPDEFAALARENKLPLVATNVASRDVSLAPPYRRFERGGRVVVVMGVLGPGALALSERNIRDALTVRDPADAVAATLKELHEQERRMGLRPADLVIVLTHLDPSERDDVLRRMPAGVDLVVMSTEQERDAEVERGSGAPMVYSAPRGQLVGVIEVHWNEQGKAVIGQLVNHPVAQTLARDKKLWENYQTYTYDAQQRNLKLTDHLKEGITYAANSRCGACHQPQYEAWKKHKHGHAWQTIVDEGRSMDPACMRCHTTGFGFKEGFISLARTPGLVNAGCQSCHQVDADKHIADPKVNKAPQVDPLICRTCHTQATSPRFTEEEYVPHATCPKGKPLAPSAP